MSELTIAKVLAHYGADLARVQAQGWRTIRCPFHEDKHPSARVNLALNGFWCPVCGMRGDPIKLIQIREGLDYGRSVEWAGRIFGASVKSIREPASPPSNHSWRDELLA